VQCFFTPLGAFLIMKMKVCCYKFSTFREISLFCHILRVCTMESTDSISYIGWTQTGVGTLLLHQGLYVLPQWQRSLLGATLMPLQPLIVGSTHRAPLLSLQSHCIGNTHPPITHSHEKDVNCKVLRHFSESVSHLSNSINSLREPD